MSYKNWRTKEFGEMLMDKWGYKPKEKSFLGILKGTKPGLTEESYSALRSNLSFKAWDTPKKGEAVSPEKYLEGWKLPPKPSVSVGLSLNLSEI